MKNKMGYARIESFVGKDFSSYINLDFVEKVRKDIVGLGFTAQHTLAFYCSKAFIKQDGFVDMFYLAVEGLPSDSPTCYLVIHTSVHEPDMLIVREFKNYNDSDNFDAGFDEEFKPMVLPFTEEYFERELCDDIK